MWPKSMTPKVRFWRKVQKSDGCWSWLANTDDDGYGKFTVNSRQVLAHRFSWELHFGPIPNGMRILHKCDNPPCTNPEHLFLGTNRDNTRDALDKGRRRFNSEGGFSSGLIQRPEPRKRNPKAKHGALPPVVAALRSAAGTPLRVNEIAKRCPQLTLTQVQHAIQILMTQGTVVRQRETKFIRLFIMSDIQTLSQTATREALVKALRMATGQLTHAQTVHWIPTTEVTMNCITQILREPCGSSDPSRAEEEVRDETPIVPQTLTPTGQMARESKTPRRHCPKCGSWDIEQIPAEGVTGIPYRGCPRCHWTDKPQWRLS